jgi:DNA modification methylase
MIDAVKPPDVVPCTVLDPFSGAGTTVMVAAQLGRAGIGIELSAEYAAMSERRIAAALAAPTKPKGKRPRELAGVNGGLWS